MFVLTARFRAAKGKEKELEQLLHRVIKDVRQNEKKTLMYDFHRKIDNPREIFFYERYTDRNAWAVTHMETPHIKELASTISNYIEGDLELTEYELVQTD
jgi:quinol monooxygenase YgiN